MISQKQNTSQPQKMEKNHNKVDCEVWSFILLYLRQFPSIHIQHH